MSDEPGALTGGAVYVRVADEAPECDSATDRPTLQRLVKGNRVNLIAGTFAPGQVLDDHKAAHPITVQCLAGTLDFVVGESAYRLDAGAIVHLDPMVVHRVECPDDAPTRNVMLLSMLTGQG